MGVYIYTLRRSAPLNTPIGKVFKYKYRDRLARFGSYYDRIKDRWRDPGEEQERSVLWYQDNFQYMDDCLVTVEGGEGGEVYRQRRSVPVWYDTDKLPGEWVGVLRKRKGRWYVNDASKEYERSVERLQSYCEKHSLGSVLAGSHDLETLHAGCKEHFSAKHARKGCLYISKENREDHEDVEHARWIIARATEVGFLPLGVDKRDNA